MSYYLRLWFGKDISKSRFVKKEYLEYAHTFHEKHGGKDIVFARFLPIVRTFVRFIAGFARMNCGNFFCTTSSELLPESHFSIKAAFISGIFPPSP